MINKYTLKFTFPLFENEFTDSRHKQNMKEFNCFIYLCFVNAITKIIYGVILETYIFAAMVLMCLGATIALRILAGRKTFQIAHILVVIQFGLLLSYNMNMLVFQTKGILTNDPSQWLNGFEACIMHTYVYLQGTNFIASTATLFIVYVAYLSSLQMYQPEDMYVQVGFFMLIIGVISMRYQFELNKRQQFLEIICNQKWLQVLELVKNQWTILVDFDQQQQLAIHRATNQGIKQVKISDNPGFRHLLRNLKPPKRQGQHNYYINNLEDVVRSRLLETSGSVMDMSYEQQDYYHQYLRQTYQVVMMDFYYNCEKKVLLILKEDTYQQSKRLLKQKLSFYQNVMVTTLAECETNCNYYLTHCIKPNTAMTMFKKCQESTILIMNVIATLANLKNIQLWLNATIIQDGNIEMITNQVFLQLLKPIGCRNINIINQITTYTNLNYLQTILFNLIYLIRTILDAKIKDIELQIEEKQTEVYTYLHITITIPNSNQLKIQSQLANHIFHQIPYCQTNRNNRYTMNYKQKINQLMFSNLTKCYNYLQQIPQTQNQALNLAFALTIAKYLLTTFGTTNSIKCSYGAEGKCFVSFEILNLQKEQQSPDISNARNRSIFQAICPVRQLLLSQL